MIYATYNVMTGAQVDLSEQPSSPSAPLTLNNVVIDSRVHIRDQADTVTHYDQIAIAFDQLLNTLLGGTSDETLSARAHRTGSAWEYIIDTLFFWQTDHCFEAYLSEKERKQLPREYR